MVVRRGIALYPSPPSVPEQISGIPSKSVIIALEASRFTYGPEVLYVKAGQNVTIQITDVDAVHGIQIPALQISGTKKVTFVAPAPGTYAFSCPTMCGSGHREMKGSLIVK